MAAIVAVVAVGGIGFAAFTANAYVNGSATGGIAEIHWAGSPTETPTGYVSCPAPTYSSYQDALAANNVLAFAATGFAPGDSCTVADTAVNGGSVGISVVSTIGSFSISGGNGCTASEWTMTDSGGASYGVSHGSFGNQAPGATFSVSVTVTLNSGAGNECQSATLSFSDVLTGTSYA